jgi:hypothetical protein
MPVTHAAVRASLADVDYPATKDDLLAAARRNNADGDVERALRAVPPEEYRNLEEVLRSTGTDDEAPELSARLRAPRRREHTHPGLAEREKDV